MSDSKLVDIQPGGESTQYESIREFTIPAAKQTGQLGGNSAHTKSEKPGIPYSPDDAESIEKRAREEDAEQARKLALGEATASSSGYTDKDLKPETRGDTEAAKSRREQGYGPGSGVGA
ncbi:hypothetical protein P170DRAFT_476492 [Aspergillus steynii IBT 23096]|uniref:Uncharacterized protein n=1 Tax=Aspergillus steynii IBT 23096 TaxID=1392250 RepID=A0A2I2G4L1_9EURO|nr:uncharacterized protein P170DRAFT_476492 [Aspergillus steynii IBT 23096]PLB47820.1 hypothetical protein P170DRAFT_476492 [Aspergillus steynii IBT 23096]